MTKNARLIVRQAWENRLVYVILAEDSLVLAEAQAPQPDHNVHSGAPQSGVAHIICLGSEGVQGGAASQDTVECNGHGRSLTPFYDIA
jgi:hypothetical protein